MLTSSVYIFFIRKQLEAKLEEKNKTLSEQTHISEDRLKQILEKDKEIQERDKKFKELDLETKSLSDRYYFIYLKHFIRDIW